MDYEKDLHELCETLSREIGETNEKIRKAGGKLSAGDLEYVDKLTHALKSVKATMKMMEDEGYSGYYPYAFEGGNMGSSNRGSYRGGSNRGSYNDGGSYRGGSYARGRGSNANRDSRGRYSNEGYSRGGDMVEELRELMEDAPDERTKQEFQRFISKIESM